MWQNGTWTTLLPSEHMVRILHHGYTCHASLSQVRKICERQSYSVQQKKHTGTGIRAENRCKSTRTTSATIVSTSICAMLQPDGDTTDSNAQPDTTRGRARIQRTFSEIATKPNEGGMDPDVKTTTSPKELPGCAYGSTLPETPTVCRDKLSLTLSTNADRSKRNWLYHPTGCDTTSGAETIHKLQEDQEDQQFL